LSYIFLPDAHDELYEAAFRYEKEKEALGDEFRTEIDLLLERILANPTLPRVRRGGFRRINSKRFPYYLAYYIRGETIVIAAVAHGHRRPGYRKDRVGS
jgi:plasmid stabilization system protein ParE